MAKIIAGCSHCGHLFKIEELFEGIDVDCPKCGKKVVVSKVADRDERGLPVFSDDMDQILDKLYKKAEQMEHVDSMEQIEQMAETMEVKQEDLIRAAEVKGETAVRQFKAKKPASTKYKVMKPKKSIKKYVVLVIILALVAAGAYAGWSFWQEQKRIDRESNKLYAKAQGMLDVENYDECFKLLDEFDAKYSKTKIAKDAQDLRGIATLEASAAKLLDSAKKEHDAGNIAAALQNIEKLIKDFSDSRKVANAKDLQKEWTAEKAKKEAESDYSRAMELRQDNKPEEALALFEKVASGNWDFSDDARQAAESISRDIKDAKEIYQSGQDAIAREDYPTAITSFQEVLDKYPYTATAKLATTALEEAKASKDKNIEENYNKHVASAKQFEQRGEWRKAYEEYEEALKWKDVPATRRDIESAGKMADKHDNMIKIPGGAFTMGSENGDPDEEPTHEVTLKTYHIAKHPVTNGEYKRFVIATGHRVPYVNAKWAEPYNWDPVSKNFPSGKEKHPVVLVTYDDALAYCEWCGKRLPTEAEWEKAARGAKGQTYPWGESPPSDQLCNFMSNNKGTTPVDMFSAGASLFGTMDMAGNVWEWCLDFYKNDFYNDPGHAADPLCDTNTGTRVIRGGCWVNSADILRSANRYWSEPDKKVVTIGFRTAFDD